MTFSQEMFVPTDTSVIDYGGIFTFEVISAIDTSSVVDKKTSEREKKKKAKKAAAKRA